MQTFLWILIAYCMISMLCYLVMEWDYKDRGHKIPSLDPTKFPYRKVFTVMSIIPVVNLRIVAKIIRVRLQERYIRAKHKRHKKKIIRTLRERAKAYEEGAPSVSEAFRLMADQMEKS